MCLEHRQKHAARISSPELLQTDASLPCLVEEKERADGNGFTLLREHPAREAPSVLSRHAESGSPIALL